MDEVTRQNILYNIIDAKTNKINHFCLKKEWYEKKQIVSVYNDIFKLTNFLDKHEGVSLRERIYYIQLNLNQEKLCPYCNKNKLAYDASYIKFRTRCSDINCKKIQTSLQSKINNSKMTELQKIEKAKKCSIFNKKSFIERYGSEKATLIKNKIRNALLGKKHSKETNSKRILTRKNNGKLWHTHESREKISQKNKKTHLSVEFKEKYRDVYRIARIKQSNTIKEKILNGEFTPCITNSWTRWRSFININNNTDRKYFRSNWDAAFWLINKNDVEYEILRIPYIINGKQKIYIVDFYDKKNKIAYEIKPDSLKNKKENIIKEQALIEYCKKNKIDYKLISNDWFKHNIHMIDFDQQPQLLKSFKKLICQI